MSDSRCCTSFNLASRRKTWPVWQLPYPCVFRWSTQNHKVKSWFPLKNSKTDFINSLQKSWRTLEYNKCFSLGINMKREFKHSKVAIVNSFGWNVNPDSLSMHFTWLQCWHLLQGNESDSYLHYGGFSKELILCDVGLWSGKMIQKGFMCSEDTKHPTRVFIYASRCKQSHLHCITKLLLPSKSQQSRSSAQWHFSQKRVPRRANLLVSWPAQQCTFWSEPLHHRRWGGYAADRYVSTLPASPSLICLLVVLFMVTCCCRRIVDDMHLWRPLVNNIWWAHLLWWFMEVSNCNYPASYSSSWKNGKTILELLACWGSC